MKFYNEHGSGYQNTHVFPTPNPEYREDGMLKDPSGPGGPTIHRTTSIGVESDAIETAFLREEQHQFLLWLSTEQLPRRSEGLADR